MSVSCNVVQGIGGWNIRVDTPSCPDSAPVYCGVGLQVRCCPSGYSCAGEDQNICCPEGSDCEATIENLALCADPSWGLFHKPGPISSSNGAWCCQPYHEGLYTDAGVVCQKVGSVPVGVSVAISTNQVSTCSTSVTTSLFSASVTTPAATLTTTTFSMAGSGGTITTSSSTTTLGSGSDNLTYSPPSPATSTPKAQSSSSSGATQIRSSSSASHTTNQRSGVLLNGKFLIVLGIALGSISWAL